MSQRDRVLAALRSRGARGVTAVDFLLPNVIDGMAPITRVAARVLELRQEGHEIVVEGERDSCSVYRLLRDAQDDPHAALEAATQEHTQALQQVRDEMVRTLGSKPRSAIFGWDEDAA